MSCDSGILCSTSENKIREKCKSLTKTRQDFLLQNIWKEKRILPPLLVDNFSKNLEEAKKFCNNKHGYKDKRVYFNKKHGADGMVSREKSGTHSAAVTTLLEGN